MNWGNDKEGRVKNITKMNFKKRRQHTKMRARVGEREREKAKGGERKRNFEREQKDIDI